MSASIESRTLRRIASDLREPVKAAVEMGWTYRASGRGGLILYSPDKVHTVSVPSVIGDSRTVRNVSRELLRYTPEATAAARTLAALEERDDEAVISLGTLVHEAGGAFGPVVAASLPEPEPVEPDPIKPEPEPLHVVSAKPWMARTHVHKGGKSAALYPSNSVIERRWSDGTTDYQCAVCDFESPKPRSVSGHAGRHTIRGEKNPVDTTPTLFDQPIDGPNTIRVAGLAKEIEAAIREAPGAEDTAEWARNIAEHIVRARIERRALEPEHEPEPLTDTELVTRLRSLLLRDEHRRLADAEVHNANLRVQVAQLSEEVGAAKATTERYKETLRTLSEMAKEEGAG